MNTKIAKCPQEIIDSINSLDLKSDRLLLTKFSANEIEYNVKHEMSSAIMRYIRDPIPLEETYHRTLKIAKKWSGLEGDWVLFALRLKENNEYIGMVCFNYISIERDTAEIGWRLGEEHHGNGYATEAASCFLAYLKTEIKPHKVIACCVAENTASSNIMTKLGMRQEALFKEFSKLNGEWFDEAIYSLILKS